MRSKEEEGDIIKSKVLEECELYDVVLQTVLMRVDPEETYTVTSIMSKDGDYAGGADDTRKFFDKHGIAPEMRSDEAHVCSVGWSERGHKYYGWSHRAFHGYAIGDKSFDGSRTIETKDQARESAAAFAEDVS